MKRLKRVLCFVLPLVLAVAVAIGVILPVSLATPVESERKKEVNEQSTYGGQVTYAADDTGAHTAAREYKGGAIFLEPNSNMTMSGGSITGHSNTYGGAIYISNGATFTMTGGTISNNSATYGGAIYVESGGKCIIEAGAIKGNKANHGAAVYVEQGGEFSASPEAEVAENEIENANFSVKVSEGTIVFGNWNIAGALGGSNLQQVLHYAFIGSFPQTYVSREYDAELYNNLEQGYSSGELNEVGAWHISNNVWDVYDYNGEAYVRGECKPFAEGYTYKNKHFVAEVLRYADSPSSLRDTPDPNSAGRGEDVVQRTEWFKVEPVRWLVLNFDKWKAGEEDIELITEEILAAMPFSTRCSNMVWCDDISMYNEYAEEDVGMQPYLDGIPEIREWLNGEFYSNCFSLGEKGCIKETQNPNSFDRFSWEEYLTWGDGVAYEYFSSPPSEWTGDVSKDNIYLLTYYDLMTKYRTSDFHKGIYINPEGFAMTTSPTDFALANGIEMETENLSLSLLNNTYSVQPCSRYRLGMSDWWLRTSVGYPAYNDGDVTLKNNYISCSGLIQACGEYYNTEMVDENVPPTDNLGVRPSMHLNIKP